MERACDGRSTILVLSRDACRAGGCVFVSCACCVRSSFGRVLCGVRLVLVRVAFVRVGLSTGQRRTCDGLLTGGGRAGIRLMPTFCDIPRWAVARRRTCHGRETDTPRATHGRTTGGARASLRTSDGRATGGLRSDLDKPRCAEMGGGRLRGTRTSLGRHTDWKRTPLSHKLLTELAALPTR